jgi:hypothetical protein
MKRGAKHKTKGNKASGEPRNFLDKGLCMRAETKHLFKSLDGPM